MYCDNCKERPATVHITQIHNDKKVEMHLCEACAAKKGTYVMNWGQGLTEGFTLPNLLSGFFGGAMPLVNGPVDSRPSPASCPGCGMSFHQFTQTGRLGCRQCYDSYASQIEPILRRIHGNTQHLGRVPARSGEKVRLQKTIDNLKKKLQDAVSREEYEQAAELRDRIKALEREKEIEERGVVGLSIADVFDRKDISWMDGTGPDSDIVISSRVRLARNLYKFPFPHLLDDTTGPQVMQLISQSVSKSGDKVIKGLELVTLDALSTLDRNILMEKHLLSPEHAASSAPYQGLIVDKDGSLAIMINEEDHLRIQCLLSGLQLNQAYKYAQTVDDALEKLLDYAFSEKLGYLTACPTNVGTGMRASVMLHLPAMALTNQISSVVQGITQVGLTVRGMYGEGTEAAGNLYQLSNQVTLGQTEEDIINNLWVITVQLATQERNLRERLQKEIKYQIEDKVMRSYGLLTNARLLTSAEALSLLSDVRMGIEMGILSPVKREVLNQLIVAINPSHVQKAAGRELEPRERDIKRAEIIKEKLLAS